MSNPTTPIIKNQNHHQEFHQEGHRQQQVVMEGAATVTAPEESAGVLKGLEMSAQEVVDRISIRTNTPNTTTPGQNQHLTDHPSAAGGDLKDTRKYSAAAASPGTTAGIGGEVEEMKGGGSGGPTSQPGGPAGQDEGQSGQGSAFDVIISRDSEHVQNLLATLEKWIQGANSETGYLGPIESTISGLGSFHWVFSIESYLRSLDWSSLKILSDRFNDGLLKWTKNLLHFQSERTGGGLEYNKVIASWSSYGGVLALAQFNLKTLFPLVFYFENDQYQFDDPNPSTDDQMKRSPMIYQSSHDNFGLQLVTKLGLPTSCLSTIDFSDIDWVSVLEERILLDIKRNSVPLILLLSLDECNQDLEKGAKLAGKFNIWIHLYGSNLLPYMFSRPESDQIGNSFTIDMNKWIKSPSLPYLTFYKRPLKADYQLLEYCELENNIYSEVLLFAPYFITAAVGEDEMKVLLNQVKAKGNFLLSVLRLYPGLIIIPNYIYTSSGEVIVTHLTFQYNSFKKIDQNEIVADDEEKTKNENISQYVDTLNSWLFHIMDRDFKDLLPLDFIVDKRTIGSYLLRIDVLQYARATPEEDEYFKSTFEKHMSVLGATVQHKIQFKELVDEIPQLEWVNHVALWAGLGAVRFIPEFYRAAGSKDNSQNQNNENTQDSPSKVGGGNSSIYEAKENIDHLNAKIVDKLKIVDTAFSLGETGNGDWCVQFGMVTHDTDIKELVRLVVATGQEIEESKEFLQRMSELVKKGIEKATEELKRESEEQLWEEGILRKVPLVGTFVNWWSPQTKETSIRGRALNLTQGSVESTELIYKYHMQMKVDTPTSPTPGPAGQQSAGQSVDDSRMISSRSSSTSSSISHSNLQQQNQKPNSPTTSSESPKSPSNISR